MRIKDYTDSVMGGKFKDPETVAAFSATVRAEEIEKISGKAPAAGAPGKAIDIRSLAGAIVTGDDAALEATLFSPEQQAEAERKGFSLRQWMDKNPEKNKSKKQYATLVLKMLHQAS